MHSGRQAFQNTYKIFIFYFFQRLSGYNVIVLYFAEHVEPATSPDRNFHPINSGRFDNNSAVFLFIMLVLSQYLKILLSRIGLRTRSADENIFMTGSTGFFDRNDCYYNVQRIRTWSIKTDVRERAIKKQRNNRVRTT